MSRKRRTSWKIRTSPETMADLAPSIWEPHVKLVGEQGYRLCRSSGLWRRANGTLTARLAYRGRDGESLAITVRNITIESDTVQEEL